MATLYKNEPEDREDWVRWAIAFVQRGLWLDDEVNVHGPHDASGHMWGDTWAKLDSTGEQAPFDFFAKGRRKYDPGDIRIYRGEVGEAVDESEEFPLVEISQLTPNAQRNLRELERAAEPLRRERQQAAWWR